jgi:hypothetical protein
MGKAKLHWRNEDSPVRSAEEEHRLKKTRDRCVPNAKEEKELKENFSSVIMILETLGLDLALAVGVAKKMAIIGGLWWSKKAPKMKTGDSC